MTRCSICGKSTAAKIKITEPRYFYKEQNVCTFCFERWSASDYDTLDKLAMEKIL